MKLLTKENLKSLPEIGTTEGQGYDAIAQVKFFAPWNSWTMYAVEYNAEEGLFYGMVDGLEKELGYFSLAELEAVKGLFGLKIERDRHFTPTALKNL